MKLRDEEGERERGVSERALISLSFSAAAAVLRSSKKFPSSSQICHKTHALTGGREGERERERERDEVRERNGYTYGWERERNRVLTSNY